MILQARRPGDSQLLQFVPRAVLDGDFPISFVGDCVHWLDLGTGEIEFRPAESLWTPEPSNWRLYVPKDPSQPHATLRKISGDNCASISLIDIRSPTFDMISRILSALESPEHITIVCTPQTVEASLPRLRLSFFVNNKSEFECRGIPGYIIDKFQSSGTMFGLTNQLVLCPSSGSSGSELPRRVIIPQGDVSFTLDGDFPSVSITTGAEQLVHWHEYTIDTDMGRLTGNVSLRSNLYQCYLHALTSHCLPDPLLGHTGTEESIYMLGSAAFKSFQRLGDDEAKLLDSISELTPLRSYYPRHLQSMATVKWNELPTLSQHHDFHPAVCSIVNHARALEALYDRQVTFDILERDKLLLTRAATRNRVYYPHDLQSSEQSLSSIPGDVIYKSRDVGDGGSDEHAAYQTSWAVWNAQPFVSRKWLWDAIQPWKSVGPAREDISLRYSRYWLDFNIAQDWMGIYSLCCEATSFNRQDLKMTLAFSLAAASFSQPGYRDVLPLIQIFAMDARCQGHRPPLEPQYQYTLSHTSPDLAHLVTLISKSACPIEQTPAHTMQVQAIGKKKKVAKQQREQRREEYNRVIHGMASAAALTIVVRWPKELIPNLPHPWFRLSNYAVHVGPYLESIVRNLMFKDHIEGLQTVLNLYGTSTSSATNLPYTFSPRFNAKPSEAVSPSIRHLLLPSITTQSPCGPDQVISSAMTVAIGSVLPSTREDGLGSLIQEFQSSQQPLLRLYGDDLNKSYSELLRKKAFLVAERVIPSYEVLRHHRDVCRERKDAIFSKLLMTLEPYHRVDKIISMAGLWPRITPRSILRELSRDRANTLLEQWKDVIIGYAVAFLKYQQSQRLLELASRHQDEAFFREAETICEDVATACSHDWLLIQVGVRFCETAEANRYCE
jgi:hypothetical protein